MAYDPNTNYMQFSGAVNILKNKGYDPNSMSQAAMESALSSIFNSPFVVENYVGQAAPTTLTTYGPPANLATTSPNTTFVNPYGPSAPTASTTTSSPVTLTPNTSGGIGGSISMLQANGVNTSGMSEAQVTSALQNIYPPAILQSLGYTTTAGSSVAAPATTGPVILPVTTGTTLSNTFANTPGLGSTGIGVNLPASTTGNTTTSPTTLTTTGTTSPTTLTTYGPPASLAPLSTTVTPSNVNPFMTPGVNFPQRTQFNQQASAPLNISQQGNIYGAPTGTPFTPTAPTPFISVQPGGAIGSTGTPGAVPTFQNPFTAPATSFISYNTIGADIARNALLSRGFTQANVAGMNANQLATEMGKFNPGESFKIVNFADGGLTGTNNMSSTTGMVQQFQNPFGPPQPPAGMGMYNQAQQPQQHQSISVGGTLQQPGLPGLMPVGSQNQYPQGYTPIGQAPQNFLTLNVPRN
jgi:hypothetical protein